MLYASGGYEVNLYDVSESQVSSALDDIAKQLRELEKSGMLKGKLTAEEQMKLITGSKSMEECMKNAKHVQESVPENLELKKKVFMEMDKFAGPDTVLSSSTSCIMPSHFTENLAHRANCIVAHPVNPPYYVHMVEVVPSPWTSRAVLDRTCSLVEEVGQAPVVCSKEIPGFASNRIQYAILNESWNLVKDGILTVQDIDTLMSEGLAMRYAWMGQLEVCHLNADGMKNYVEKYGSTINRVSQQLGPIPSWSVEDAKEIYEEMEKIVPLNKLEERRAWRDARLMALAKLKRDMKEN